jgi:geranylgeranyl diphosphate synthase type I
MELSSKLRGRIAIIESALDDALNVGEQPKLLEAMRHLPIAGGKRLRPILVMLTAEAVGGDVNKSIQFGISLEIIHNFTLVHDDIMDQDDLRRGVKTVHNVYGQNTAINAGDALLARAFEILSSIDIEDSKLRDLIYEVARMVRQLGEGQQSDLDFEDQVEITAEEYLGMIEKKTGLMFMMAAKGGALIGNGTDEQIKAMSEYGRLLGIGFQIWDDVLDIKRSKDLKSYGSDIKAGKKTLMIVYALEHSTKEDKEQLLQILGNRSASDEDIKLAIEILNRSGAIDYTQNLAEEYANNARELLNVLPDSNSKEVLEEFVDFMVTRDF